MGGSGIPEPREKPGSIHGISRFLQEWDSIHGELKEFLGSGRDGEPLEYFPCAWSQVGAGKPSLIPEFLREFLGMDYNSSGFPAGNARPDPPSPDFPDPFPVCSATFPVFPAFPVAPSPRSACASSSMIGVLGDHENQSVPNSWECGVEIWDWCGAGLLHPTGNPKSRWDCLDWDTREGRGKILPNPRDPENPKSWESGG